MIQPDGTAHGVEVDVGVDRNVGGAVIGCADAATVRVNIATAPVAADVGVKVNVGVGVMSAKGVAVTVSALDEGDRFGVAVSARGMINGGNVALSTNVGVSAAPRDVGVRDES